MLLEKVRYSVHKFGGLPATIRTEWAARRPSANLLSVAASVPDDYEAAEKMDG